jgi:transcriptional regulator GlxA family with amidase domain
MTAHRVRDRLVVLVGYPGVQALDLVGPAEVFAAANLRRGSGQTPYRIIVASPRGGTITAGSGLRIADTTPLASLRGRIDTLVLAGGPGLQQIVAQRELPAWVEEHPASDLRSERLAKRAGMSPRHFARVFRDETGVTPGVFVEGVRVERAKLYLEETDWSLAGVAERAGFGSEDSLWRSFRRRLGVAPRDYRKRFSRPRATKAQPSTKPS